MGNFTNSPLVDLVNLSSHRSSPRNQPIRKITIHHFAGNISIEAVSDFLRQPGANASYNYGIGTDGRIVLIVNERDRCWASSSAVNDNQAVVIGLANNTGAPNWEVSEVAFNAMINLVRCICARNGITEIVYDGTANGTLTRHNFFAATACPGPFLQARFPEIMRRVNNLLRSPTQSSEFRVGDIVQFTGGGVFFTSRATTSIHWRGRSRCSVTQMSTGTPQPLHLVSNDGGGVHGWVSLRDVEAISQTTNPPSPNRTVRLDVLGQTQNVGGYIENGSTFVRLTDIASALGYSATWDDERRLPVITRR